MAPLLDRGRLLTSNNHEEKCRNERNYKQRNNRKSGKVTTPGAVSVQHEAQYSAPPCGGTTSGGSPVGSNREGTSRTSKESDNIDLLESRNPIETPSLIVATEVLIRDEEMNLGAGDNDDDDPATLVERKIQEEVELRILRDQNNAVIAEPMESSKDSNTTTGNADDTSFGLKRKIGVFIMCMGLIVAAVVAGVLLTTQGMSLQEPCALT